jgi:hypothetical protein
MGFGLGRGALPFLPRGLIFNPRLPLTVFLLLLANVAGLTVYQHIEK